MSDVRTEPLTPDEIAQIMPQGTGQLPPTMAEANASGISVSGIAESSIGNVVSTPKANGSA